jgi:hypothetical protein
MELSLLQCFHVSLDTCERNQSLGNSRTSTNIRGLLVTKVIHLNAVPSGKLKVERGAQRLDPSATSRNARVISTFSKGSSSTEKDFLCTPHPSQDVQALAHGASLSVRTGEYVVRAFQLEPAPAVIVGRLPWNLVSNGFFLINLLVSFDGTVKRGRAVEQGVMRCLFEGRGCQRDAVNPFVQFDIRARLTERRIVDTSKTFMWRSR